VLIGVACLSCMISGTAPDGGTAPSAPSCVDGGKPCEGCCAGSVCKEGKLAGECGVNAAACEACAPESFCRSPFGGCTVDMKSRWRVWVFAADIIDRDGGWDEGGGLPDPSLFLYCPAGSTSPVAFSGVAPDTLHPRWQTNTGDCILDARTLQTQGFEVVAWDDEGALSPEGLTPLSTVKVNDADFDRGWLLAHGGALENVWFRLDRQ
jgi:hypothetical protein